MSDEIETIELSDPQFDFLTSTKKHTGFVAGFASGKSFIGTLKSLNKIINHGIPKTAYYLPTYGDIRDIAFDIFPTVAEMLGYKYKLNKTDKEFILYDANGNKLGSTIFRNMSEPETIVGYQVGYTLIDETDILKEEIMDKAYKKILGRNRLVVPIEDEDILRELLNGEVIEGTYFHKKKKIWCWVNDIDVAGTPEGFKWFYKRFVKEFNPKTDLLITASTYSNMENLPDDFIETLRAQYPPELFNAYVNGQFVNLNSGVVYSYFNRRTHHADREASEYDVLHKGQDFNIGGCVSIVLVIEGNKVYAVDEIVSNDTFGIADNIRARYKENQVVSYPDASGGSGSTNATKTDIQILSEAGFMIDAPLANGRVMDSVNAVNSLFMQNRLFVNTSKCPRLTQALEQQAYDKNGEPEKLTGPATIDDFLDALRYPIVRKFPLITYAQIKGGFSR